MKSERLSRSGRVVAFHWQSWEPVEIAWNDGVIASIASAPQNARPETWIAPALFDLQINGYGGVDFQKEDLTTEELRRAARALRRDGCARFFLTLVTSEWNGLLARLRHAKARRDADPELRAAIAGWHIEGPFISGVKGFVGAHPPEHVSDPDPGKICALREATGSDPVLLTLAPERAGAMDAIAHAVSLGMTVFGGHSDASGAQLDAAVARGLTGFTHLGNGCPQALDRHDNILWRVLERPEILASMIPDTIHVAPAPFRVLHAARGGRNLIYTTDAMAAGGAPPGRYSFGKTMLEVGADQIVRLPGASNFAGSALTPAQGVFRSAAMLRRPWQECWMRFSTAAAEAVGCRAGLRVGEPADFCLIRPSGGPSPAALETWFRGELYETAD
ncbi:MAG: N-acetylglucosamine-6-phosphate deacetylase [Verrucomicrobiae bacterium]|nr:N-acetylglucosamine-6-phosphate deacetylase [Verrucomicrobiae bacterium]